MSGTSGIEAIMTLVGMYRKGSKLVDDMSKPVYNEARSSKSDGDSVLGIVFIGVPKAPVVCRR